MFSRIPYELPVVPLEDFLREIWRGIINFNSTSGPNATDESANADHAERLSDSLKIRRGNGNLSREEFFFVATMTWFHLTVEFDSPIVKDLKAEGASASYRLRKIAGRVAASRKGARLLLPGRPTSRVLIAVESGTLTDRRTCDSSPLRNDISEKITSWSSATGRNIKAEPVTASPARALTPAASPVPATTNSSAPVPASRS